MCSDLGANASVRVLLRACDAHQSASGCRACRSTVVPLLPSDSPATVQPSIGETERGLELEMLLGTEILMDGQWATTSQHLALGCWSAMLVGVMLEDFQLVVRVRNTRCSFLFLSVTVTAMTKELLYGAVLMEYLRLPHNPHLQHHPTALAHAFRAEAGMHVALTANGA